NVPTSPAPTPARASCATRGDRGSISFVRRVFFTRTGFRFTRKRSAFPICNRFDMNRRLHPTRPIAETAVADMEISDETPGPGHPVAAWQCADRAGRQRRL